MRLKRGGVLAVLVLWTVSGALYGVIRYELFIGAVYAISIVAFGLLSIAFYLVGADDAED